MFDMGERLSRRLAPKANIITTVNYKDRVDTFKKIKSLSINNKSRDIRRFSLKLRTSPSPSPFFTTELYSKAIPNNKTEL